VNVTSKDATSGMYMKKVFHGYMGQIKYIEMEPHLDQYRQLLEKDDYASKKLY